MTDAAGKVTTTTTQTCDKVVLSVTEMQKRIDNQLSEAQSKWKSGIMGTLQSTISDLKTATGRASPQTLQSWCGARSRRSSETSSPSG